MLVGKYVSKILYIHTHIACINCMYIYIYLSAAAAAKSLQPCPTLCDPIDGSPPGSSVHGVFQERGLEWGAIAFSNDESEK